MAWSFTNQLNNGLFAAQSSYTTESITLTQGKLYLLALFIYTNFGNTPDPSSVYVTSDSGTTFTKIASRFAPSSNQLKVALYYLIPSSTFSGDSINIDFSSSSDRLSWICDEVTGFDTNLSDPTRNVNTNGASNSASLTVTMGSFLQAENATYGAFASVSFGGSFTPGSGFTELADNSVALGPLETEYRVDNDTSVDATASSSGAIAGIGIEIRAPTAAAPSPVIKRPMLQQLVARG